MEQLTGPLMTVHTHLTRKAGDATLLDFHKVLALNECCAMLTKHEDGQLGFVAKSISPGFLVDASTLRSIV